MNKLIKQLIEKATVRGEEYLPGNDGHPTPTFYFDKEKFAELIVRECVANLKETKKAELPLLQAINENAREVPLSVYIVFLKEHFGVEE